MTSQPHVPPIQTVEQASQPRRRWTGFRAFVTALVLVLSAGIGYSALGLMNMLDAGSRMASTEALPPDTDIYIGIDFQSMDELDPMLLAFNDAFAAADIEPGLDGLVARIDEQLRSELGIGVDDVTPWVGRDVGISVGDIDADRPTIVAAISVRDEAGADEFIDLMLGILAERDLLMFREVTYAAVTMHVSATGFDDGPLVVARSADMLLIGNGEEAVQQAIDAHNGASLADDVAMRDAVDELPNDRALTVFVHGEAFADMFDTALSEMPGTVLGIPDEAFTTMAMSVSLVDDGLQLDIVEPVTEPVADPGPLGSSELPEMLPASTFGYVGVAGDTPLLGEDFDLDEALRQAGLPEEALAEMGLSLAELEATLGFDVEDDLLAHLGGDFGFAMLDSMLPLWMDADAPRIDLLGVMGVTDLAAIGETADRFAAVLAEEDIVVSERDVAGSTLYGIGDGDIEFVLYGVSGDYLVVATDEMDIAGLTADGAKLADDPLFVRAAEAMGGDPMFFLDMRRALDQFDLPAEDQKMIDPIAGLVAYAEETDEMGRFTMLVLIDY